MFITEKLKSSMIKMFLVQYINIGVLMILLYMKIADESIPEDLPILNGKYTKFTTQWYKVVGETITINMIIEIFAPHVSLLFKPFFKFWKRCWDRKCSCDERRTR